MGPKTKKQLEDNEELCSYCPLDEDEKGVHCYGGEPIMCCESGYCDKAYEIYLEEYENGEIEE